MNRCPSCGFRRAIGGAIATGVLMAGGFVILLSATAMAEAPAPGDVGYVDPFKRTTPSRKSADDDSGDGFDGSGRRAGGGGLDYEFRPAAIGVGISYAHHRRYPYRRFQYLHHYPTNYYGHPLREGFVISY